MIKKCPFCGGEAKQVAFRYPTDMQFADDIQKFYVTCARCKAIGKPIYLKNAQYRGSYLEEVHQAEKEALDAWNTRTADVVAMLEEFDLMLSEYEDSDLIRVEYIRQELQEKIDKLKESEDEETPFN